MTPTTRPPHDLLPLTPTVLHILLVLADEERHGYSIMQAVSRLTAGMIHMGPGTLYGTIKRMLEAGLIEETAERPDPALDDERRRYYRLSAFGERVAKAEVERLAALVASAQAQKLLGGVSG